MNLLPIGQTTQTSCSGYPNLLPSVSSSFPATPRLYLLLLPQNSNNPCTATPQRRFALCFLLLPQHSNTTKMQPFVFFPKPRRRNLLWHDLLPSTKHRTKDEDYRLQQWWISSTEPLFKGF